MNMVQLFEHLSQYEYDNNGNLLKEVECEYSESGEAEITEVFYEYKTL